MKFKKFSGCLLLARKIQKKEIQLLGKTKKKEKQKSPFFFFFKKNAQFLFLKKKTEKLYNPSNETCKKFASSEACFSISFKVKG
jgi:hypothetical protein